MSSRKTSRPSRSPSASQISEKPASVAGTSRNDRGVRALRQPFAPAQQATAAVAARAQALAGDRLEVRQLQRLQAAAVCRGA